MKVTIDAEVLRTALDVVGQAVPAKTTNANLTGVCIVATGDTAELRGTDSELYVTMTVPVKDTDDGIACLDAARLGKIAKEAGDGNVTISHKDDAEKCRVKCDGGSFSMLAGKPDLFPEPVANLGEPIASVEAVNLAEALRQVAISTAVDKARFALEGVSVSVLPKHIRCVATDGRRLSKSEVDATDATPWTGIIPRKAVGVIQNMAALAPDATVSLSGDDRTLTIAGNAVTMTTALLEGKFPSWQDVLPERFQSTGTVHTAELARGIRQARIMTSAHSQGVVFGFGGDKLTLRAAASDTGSMEARIGCEWDGPELAMSFNPDFILALLGVSRGEVVTVKANEATGVAVFQIDGGVVHAVMPIQEG